MSDAEAAALRAIDSALSGQNSVETLAAGERPEVVAALQHAFVIKDLIARLDDMTTERDNYRSAAETSEALRTMQKGELDRALERADHFEKRFNEVKETLEAIDRLAEQGLYTTRHPGAKRPQPARDIRPAMVARDPGAVHEDDGKKIPQFLKEGPRDVGAETGNIRRLRGGPVRTIALMLGAGAAFAAVVGATAAHAAEPAQGGGFIDLSPLLGFLGPLVGALLQAVIPIAVAWAAYRFHQKTGVDIDKTRLDQIDRALENEAGSLVADGEVKFAGAKVSVPNVNMAAIANGVLARIPEAKALGYTPEFIAARIIDKIPQIAAGAAIIAAQQPAPANPAIRSE